MTPETIVVVEDNDLDFESIARSFKKQQIGARLVRARDGVEALELLKDEERRPAWPFVLLLDLNLPRMSGLELLEEIRHSSEMRSTPVFVLSTSDRPEDIAEAYRFNVCGYVVKPLRYEDMLSAVGTLRAYWELTEFPASAPA